MRRIFLSVFLCLPLLSFATVYEYTLSNGLEVIVKPDTRAPVVLSTVWYRVGGGYEHNGITGLSHILEHMMFQGTPSVPAGDFAKIVNESGGQLNAMTSRDFTQYYEELSADKLALSMRLESDRMQHLIINQTRFKRELNVVTEERRMRTDDNPISLTYERFMALAFVNNPYHHPVVGWPSDLKSMTVDDARAWYHDWYMPNNAILVVVGDVKPKAVLALAQKYYGKIKPGVLLATKPRTEVPPLGEKQIDVVLPAQSPIVMLGYHVPSLVTVGADTWKAYALDVAAAILGGGESSWLAKNLIRGQHVASSADASYDLLALHSPLFAVDALPAPRHTLVSLQQDLLTQIALLKKQPVTKAELEQIKAQVVAGKVFSHDSLASQARDLGGYAVVGLPVSDAANFVAQIERVTPKQIQAVANEYFTKNNLTVAHLIPKATKPTMGVR